jgi:hypothetical protein
VNRVQSNAAQVWNLPEYGNAVTKQSPGLAGTKCSAYPGYPLHTKPIPERDPKPFASPTGLEESSRDSCPMVASSLRQPWAELRNGVAVFRSFIRTCPKS